LVLSHRGFIATAIRVHEKAKEHLSAQSKKRIPGGLLFQFHFTKAPARLIGSRYWRDLELTSGHRLMA